jgi:hypothetical protein
MDHTRYAYDINAQHQQQAPVINNTENVANASVVKPSRSEALINLLTYPTLGFITGVLAFWTTPDGLEFGEAIWRIYKYTTIVTFWPVSVPIFAYLRGYKI